MTPEELIAELRATVDHDVALGLKPPLHAEIRALLDRIASLEAALAQAREALEPFARQAAEFHESWPDSMIPVCGIPEEDPEDDDNAKFTIGDLRRAAALSSSKQKDGEDA